MKSVIGYLVVAVALRGRRAGALRRRRGSRTRTADAQQMLLTLRYGDLDGAYEALRAEASSGAVVPRLSQALVSSLREQQSTSRYWLGAYGRLTPERDAAGALSETDPLRARTGRPCRLPRGPVLGRSGRRREEDRRHRARLRRRRARQPGQRSRGLELRVRVARAGLVRAEQAAGRSRSRPPAAWPATCRPARPCTAAGRAARGRRHEAVQGRGADASRRAQAAATGRQRRRAAQAPRDSSWGSLFPPSTGRRSSSGSPTTCGCSWRRQRLLVVWLWQVARRRADVRRYLRHRAVPVRETFSAFGGLLFWLCLLGATTSVILALARPQVVTTRVRRAGIDLVVLQDGSTSMRVTDTTGDRWKRSMRFLRVLAETMRWDGDRIAMTSFARIATPQVRLTQGPQHVLLLHRPPRGAAVPRRRRRLVGHEHRDGHLAGA